VKVNGDELLVADTMAQIAATRICRPPIRWFSSAVSVADKAASTIFSPPLRLFVASET
jgi:hypothetical protein